MSTTYGQRRNRLGIYRVNANPRPPNEPRYTQRFNGGDSHGGAGYSGAFHHGGGGNGGRGNNNNG